MIPRSTDYFEAVQNLRSCMSDEELLGGQVAMNDQGLPLLWSGGFADVYRIECPATGNTWALKCFTRQVADQRERYRQISAHLDQAKLPFTVDFQYLESGIRIAGRWFPALKMRWVEGLALNQFVESHLDSPKMLDQLLALWPKLAERLRAARIAHADLQHGNVLLVPTGKQLALRLIDYDGMYVPALAGRPSGELGHPAYQHPQRLREGTYSPEVDRFSHLAIYCAVRCLRVGRHRLWQEFSNDDNLLFRESDFRNPGESSLFRTLWELPDAGARALTGRLALACDTHLENVPLLGEVLVMGKIMPLDPREESAVKSILAPALKPRGTTITEDDVPLEWLATPAEQEAIQRELAAKPLPPPLANGQRPLLSRMVSKVVQLIGGWGPEPEQTAVATEAVASEGTSAAPPSEQQPATPWHRSLLKRLVAPLRAVDRLLLAMVGQDNTILHNFVRFVAIMLLAVAAAIAGWQLYEQGWARPARELAAARLVQEEADRKAAAENKKAEEAAQRKAEEEAARKKRQDEADRKKAAELAAQEKATLEAARKKADADAKLQREIEEKAKAAHEALFTKPIRVFTGHRSHVTDVAFSPDGNRVLTGSDDYTAILWDAETGRQIHVFQRTNVHNWVSSVAFSHDGNRVLTASGDGSTIVWDANSGAQIRLFRANSTGVLSAAFSPDGNRLLTGSRDHTAILWDAHTGRQLHVFQGHHDWVRSVAFSPDGKRAVTGSRDTTAILWDLQTGRQLHVLKKHNNEVVSAVFSPDGKHVLTGSSDCTAILWDAESGQPLRVFRDFDSSVTSVAFSRDNNRILVAAGNLAVLRDARTGQQLRIFKGHDNWVTSAAFSPDNKQVLTGSADGTAILWDADTSKPSLLAGTLVPSVGTEITFDLGGNVKLQIIPIPPGFFHDTLIRPFFLGKYEVTQEQWNALMDGNPSKFQGPTNPVDGVGIDDCDAFLERLNKKCAAAGLKFRLPTAIEWEYACLAGGKDTFCYGNDEARLGDYAWFADNAGGKTHPVGKKRPNIWGLYDMHGNVCEWCSDFFPPQLGHNIPAARGGSWIHSAANCAAALLQSPRPDTVGLRVAFSPASLAPNAPPPTRTTDDPIAKTPNTSATIGDSPEPASPDTGTYYAIAVVDMNWNRLIWSKIVRGTKRRANNQLQEKYRELVQDVLTARDTLEQKRNELQSLNAQRSSQLPRARGTPFTPEEREQRDRWSKQLTALWANIRELERTKDARLMQRIIPTESHQAAAKRIAQWEAMEQKQKKLNGTQPGRRSR